MPRPPWSSPACPHASSPPRPIPATRTSLPETRALPQEPKTVQSPPPLDSPGNAGRRRPPQSSLASPARTPSLPPPPPRPLCIHLTKRGLGIAHIHQKVCASTTPAREGLSLCRRCDHGLWVGSNNASVFLFVNVAGDPSAGDPVHSVSTSSTLYPTQSPCATGFQARDIVGGGGGAGGGGDSSTGAAKRNGVTGQSSEWMGNIQSPRIVCHDNSCACWFAWDALNVSWASLLTSTFSFATDFAWMVCRL